MGNLWNILCLYGPLQSEIDNELNFRLFWTMTHCNGKILLSRLGRLHVHFSSFAAYKDWKETFKCWIRCMVPNRISNYKGIKAHSFALLISRYILRLRQAAQKQQRPRCPNPKMYLEIRKADESLFKFKSWTFLRFF